MQTRKHKIYKKKTVRKMKESNFHRVKSLIHKHSLDRELLHHL